MEHVFEGPYEMVPNFLKHVLTKFRIDVDRKHSDTVVVVCHPETYEEIKESELLHSNSRWVIKRLYRKAHDHVQCLDCHKIFEYKIPKVDLQVRRTVANLAFRDNAIGLAQKTIDHFLSVDPRNPTALAQGERAEPAWELPPAVTAQSRVEARRRVERRDRRSAVADRPGARGLPHRGLPSR